MRNLNNIYKFNIEETHSEHLSYVIENEIDKVGADNIKKKFLKVFEEIENILSKTESKFADIIYLGKSYGKFRAFQIIFLAIYNMIVLDNMVVNNYVGLLRHLKGIGDRVLNNVNSDEWGASFRDEKIRSVQGIISEFFERADKIDDPALDNWTIQLENLLTQSKIEQQQFDFKIGFHRLDTNANFVDLTFSKVIKTLTSMANIGPNKKGYVIVGIADNDNDKNTFENLYSTKSKSYGSFNITGIDKEALKSFGSIDIYFNRIRDLLKKQPIDDYTKDYIGRNMKMINYFDKSVLVFQIESSSKPLLYDNKFYERKASSVDEVQPINYADLFDRFNKNQK